MGTLFDVDAITGDLITAGSITSTSTTSGFLLPKLTTTQRNAIPTPATGLQVFNTTTNQIEFFDGTFWTPTGGTTPPAGSTGSVQFNNTGSFGGDAANLFWNDTTDQLGIGTNTPAASASLDITSISRGFLPPRMTTGQRNAIVTPVAGLQIYNISTVQPEVYNGTIWTAMGSGSGTVTSVAMSVPAFLSVSGSPVTTSGTFAVSLSGTALPVANGGTGAVSLAAFNVLLGNGTSAITPITPSTSGFVLTSNGTGANPAFKPTGIGNVVSIATSGSVTPDAATGSTFSTTLSGALTINGPSNPTDGQKITFRLIQSGTPFTVTFSTGAGNFRFGTDIPAFTASAANLTDYVGAIYNSGANRWDLTSVIQGF